MNRDEDLEALYRELVLDHARSPRNFGKLEEATHSAEGINPLCGDKLHLYLAVDADGRIANSAFEGSGCAISIASASLMTETVRNLSRDDADRYYEAMTSRLTDGPADSDADVDLERLKALDGVRQYPARVKCATLAWHALHAALNGSANPATTE